MFCRADTCAELVEVSDSVIRRKPAKWRMTAQKDAPYPPYEFIWEYISVMNKSSMKLYQVALFLSILINSAFAENIAMPNNFCAEMIGGECVLQIDSFNDVPAYINSSTDATSSGSYYQCAEFLARYFHNRYQTDYTDEKDVNNNSSQGFIGKDFHPNYAGMANSGVPTVDGGKGVFVAIQASDVQPEDVVIIVSGWIKHAAIVKSVDGNTITLIEQNWGFYDDNDVFFYSRNRTVNLPKEGYYLFRFQENQADLKPTAINDAFQINQDSSLNSNVLDNNNGTDVLGNTPIKEVVITQPPSKGKISSISNDGAFTYTPNDGETGSDSFKYKIIDADGDESEATVTITIKAVVQDKFPEAKNDFFETPKNTKLSGNVFEKNGDGVDSLGDTPIIGVIVLPSNMPTKGFIFLTMDDGDFEYTPSHNETGVDSFKYKIVDADGDESEATVTITITAVVQNKLPEAKSDSFETLQDTDLNGNVFDDNKNGTDVLGDTPITEVVITQSPNKGSVDSISKEGDFTYIPNGGVTDSDSFKYKIVDADGDESEAEVTITIMPTDKPSTSTFSLPTLRLEEGVVVNSFLGDGLYVETEFSTSIIDKMNHGKKGKVICGGITENINGTDHIMWYINWNSGLKTWASGTYLKPKTLKPGEEVTVDSSIGYVNLRELTFSPPVNKNVGDTDNSSLLLKQVKDRGIAKCGGVRDPEGQIWWLIKWGDDTEGWSIQGSYEQNYLVRVTAVVKPALDSDSFEENPEKIVFSTEGKACVASSLISKENEISFGLTDLSDCTYEINGQKILPPLTAEVVYPDGNIQTTYFPFRDVKPDSEGAKAIATLWSLGIVEGYEGTGGKFGHSSNVSRTEFLKMSLLARARGDTLEAKKVYQPLEWEYFDVETDSIFQSFNDTAEIVWGYGYIKYAAEGKIMSGFRKDGETGPVPFRPNSPVTREQAAKILINSYCDDYSAHQDNVEVANFDDNKDGCIIHKTATSSTDDISVYNRVHCKDSSPYNDVPEDLHGNLCKFVAQAKENQFIAGWDGVAVDVDDDTAPLEREEPLLRWEMAISACRLYAKVANVNATELCSD